MDMLSNLETPSIQLAMSEPNRAGLLMPIHSEENKDEHILMLVMPVMLNR